MQETELHLPANKIETSLLVCFYSVFLDVLCCMARGR